MSTSAPSSAPVQLISRSVLFGNPEKISPQLSPDGRHLSYLAPNNEGVLQVWVRTLGKKDDRVLTHDAKRGIRSYFWTYQPDQLIYAQDSDGDENYHLYRVDVKAGTTTDLTPYPGARAELIGIDPRVPDSIVVGLNVRDPHTHDVYRIHLSTQKAQLEIENPGNIIGWTADADLNVRAAITALPDGSHDLLVSKNVSEKNPAAWTVLRHFDPDDQGSPVEFSLDGKTLYYLSNQGSNAQRLLSVELESGRETVLAEDAQYDVENALFHPTRRTLRAASFYKDKLQWTWLEKETESQWAFLSAGRRGELRIISSDLADKTWLLAESLSDGPVYYYTYAVGSKNTDLLFVHQPKLEGLPLAPMQPVSFASRDGLTVHGYLSLPKSGKQNLPTVLLVHGGPWARDKWGFFPVVQMLANRGYAVLQVNYRGSTGYGKAFLNAGNREWAAKMHDDLIDAVEWLKAQGISDPKRIAIMGGSYGGYATLVGLTYTPDVFAAGIDIVGPSNLMTLIKTIPPYWAPMLASFARRVGDLDDEAFMRSRSPLYLADRIVKPLLIGQGANDPRVKISESDQIVEAMRKNGKPVEYWVYSDEGHGFARPENRMHFYAQTEAFLARHIGGQSEPIADIPGHSGQRR